MNPRRPVALLCLLQALLGVRIVLRLLRTAGGERIVLSDAPLPAHERVSVVVPVLNEQKRLGPCIEGLISQGDEVVEVLVVDGGSTDGTRALVRSYEVRDPRVRLIDAPPLPPDWNGKAWGLQCGFEQVGTGWGWVLTIDADVRPAPALTRSLVAHARAAGVPALSVATRQVVSGAGEGMVHPAMLATLVYRFGIPGHAARRVNDVQANGQCFLVRRQALASCDGFAAARDSVCEDVTLARALVQRGHPVGFYEADGLVSVRMYEGWRDTWSNWSRSLPMRDQFSGASAFLGLAEVTLVQALPLPLFAGLRLSGAGPAWALAINGILAVTRLGVLMGIARAYERIPWTYPLSPLADLPVAAQLWRSALRRRHTWRGRTLVRR